MKTTVDISDPLFREARQLAERDRTTLRALIEQGLRHVVSERKKPKKPFKLRDASFKGGQGLQEGVTWDKLRELAYERNDE